jgi:hypothetical protein
LKKTADKYGSASVTNITLFFDVHLGRENEGMKKASYNHYNHALRDAIIKVENHHPNCIYKHNPRQMPKVKETIIHSSRKRNKKCGDDPKLNVHKKDTNRVMSFFEYQKCVEHANLDSEDLEGLLQYLKVRQPI